MTHTVAIDESQRQLLLLALAQLSLERPGFHFALGELAARVPGGTEMYERFLEINADPISQPEPWPQLRKIYSETKGGAV